MRILLGPHYFIKIMLHSPVGGSHPAGSLQDPMINFLLVGKRGNLSYLIVMTPGNLKPFFHSSLKRIYSEKKRLERV